MKILVLNGSPRKDSDTMILTSAFLEGLKDNDIEIINIIEKDIKPCVGCFSCLKRDEIKCAIDDYQNEILDKIIDSDVIIYSFPLYFYSVPSHLKASWDRLLPLTKWELIKTGDRYDHVLKCDLSKKKFIIISGCGLPDFEDNFKALKIMCKNTFYYPICIFARETPILHNPNANPITAPFINKFREAGIEFSKTLDLKEETIEELEKPMLCSDIYMEIVNKIHG